MKERRTARKLALALVGAGCLIFTPALRAAGMGDSEEVSKLLSEAKTEAFALKEDAAAMETFTRSEVTWESHVATVNLIKEHINAVGRELTKLDAARPTASPWQATAIDRIKPLLKELAANTEAIITHLNKNPRNLKTNEYKDYL